MSRLPDSFHELQAVFDRWSESLPSCRNDEERIQYFSRELPGLLLNRQLIEKILAGIVQGGSYPDARQATMFSNEFILYINPRRLFSVRMYIYGPGQYTPVHDHNSWGVYGCVSNRIEVIRFRCRNGDSRTAGGLLQETDRPILQPGETLSVLPLNKGIHQAGNPDQTASVMFSVYGTPIRRLYVNQYDIVQNTVTRRYPPRLRKKRLAAQALHSMTSPA